ncbi:4-hydroxyproline epimerase [Acinetobacter sp. IK40]|jgi:4-hydroxyproline epimerase|uniref:4-hydroxyproline epimerase n=1 Tax=Acinetobacter sp. IK40 TaxID=2928897 RepID=UPI002D1E7A26|nr:4-hydroxyproline epimerase [Acinetobacter sp. IK40]MEB3790580.1 4-hydroxyproline epimerase [Acinetobacter sp. IK40]
MKTVKVLDSHTGGEPTRLVLEGFPDLGSGDMESRRKILSQQYDHFRTATMLEPRGNDVLVGALLCKPVNPKASAGVIFFNNTGYLGMCGHGTIGLVASLAHLGQIQVGTHLIETPVGDVEATLHEDGSVSVRNVPAYRYQKAVEVEIAQYGKVTGDIAWGGNWFFLINDHGQSVTSDHLDQLTEYAWTVRQALNAQGITGKDGQEIDHIELFTSDTEADSKNFVLCPGKAYDRSPCGTGTSAKIACLAADGKLEPGTLWKQASIIGSQFVASYEQAGEYVIPTIRGEAYMSAEAILFMDEKDPFAWGIQL